MTMEVGTPRPDKTALLSKLKGFQRRTVEHVVRKLCDPGGSRRFLVADEVGLGKTLVARGVVAEVIDRLWDNVGRIDILYVCSNTALASENLRKVHLGGKRIEGTRLTLIPKQLPDFDPKLNFISFTPGTALQLVGPGRVDERVVLYALLQRKYGTPAWLMNLLQGSVGTDNWRNRHIALPPELDDEQSRRFLERLAQHPTLQRDLTWASETLVRSDSRLDDEQAGKRYQIVGGLRRLLAHSCIDALQPDVIILDEFQRFKDLISGTEEKHSELSALADELFGYVTPEGNRVATLLLSATPYRMYATDDESMGGDHYEDFLDTLRFLCDDARRFGELEASLERYRNALLGAASGIREQASQARDDLQRRLKDVMVRTERVDSTEDRNAMVEEPAIRVPVTRRDLAHYVATEEMAEQLGARDVVEFWKSAPYLFNFMKSYQMKHAFEEQRHIKAVRECFERVAAEFLSLEQIQQYEAIDPANGRLRALAEEALGDDQWSMLWLPPTLPYWPLSRAWSKAPHFSKKLVFSAWNVVPDVVSALLSYDAERRMVGVTPPAAYAEFYKRRRPLLRYSMPDGRPANMTTLALALPCFTLSDGISPLRIAVEGKVVLTEVRERVSKLVGTLAELAGDGPADPRWHWAALILLDRNDHTMRELLEAWVTGDHEEDADGPSEAEASGDAPAHGERALRGHLGEALQVLNQEVALGAIPPSLVDTLTDLTLGSPAIATARALQSKQASAIARRRAAVRVANAFRSLFNQPPVTQMLRAAGDDESYWRATLQYAIDGNLQAVLDEQVHLLWEQHAWDDKPADEVCARVAGSLEDAVTTKVSRVSPDIYSLGERRIEDTITRDEKGTPERVSLRTSFALRYGSVTGASGALEAREESVRTAFKSPFFPFVLVSTSVGQEGLDFHPWCHDVWHWNLPGNPVDLEQREGRIHRYKGLAVRKNVAENAMDMLRQNWKAGQDPWDVLFACAEQRRGDSTSELVPCWVAPGPHKVRRFVPALPFSSEIEQFRRLKRSLAIYRVVFGQPRQQELLEFLEGSELTREELDKWTISLRPDPA